MRYQALCRINFHGESKSQRDLALRTELVMGQGSGVAYSVWTKPVGSETFAEQSHGVVQILFLARLLPDRVLQHLGKQMLSLYKKEFTNDQLLKHECVFREGK